MTTETIKDLLADHARMQARRSGHEGVWREIARYCSPARDVGVGATMHGVEGRDGQPKIASSTGMIAARDYASAIEGLLMPRMQRWHSITRDDGSGAGEKDAALFETIRDALFFYRGHDDSGFSTAKSEAFRQLALFGQGPLFVRPRGDAVRYSAIPVSELYVAANDVGVIDKVHREFCLEKRAALRAWPAAPWPAWVTDEQCKPDHSLHFIHVVKPMDELPKEHQIKVVSAAKGEFRFGSLYVLKGGGRGQGAEDRNGDSAVIAAGAFLEMPYVFARGDVIPGEYYGRSIAECALPDIRTEAALMDAILRGASWGSRPAILGAGTDPAGMNKRIVPGAYVPGGIDQNGNPRYAAFAPLLVSPEVLAARAEAYEQRIQRAFFLHLLTATPERPQQTATEYLGRQAELITLMGAPLGRLFDELIKPLVRAEIAALIEIGAPGFGPEVRDAGIQHEGRFAQLHRAAEMEAAMQWIAGVAQLAGLKPEEAIASINAPEFIRILTKATGVPSALQVDKDDVKAEVDEEKRQTALLQQAQLAQQFSGAARNVGLVAGSG